MADVKWIKIVTDIFDDEKILLIESMPESDAMIVIWFKLLTLAGKINNGGVLLFNDKLSYTDEMLATIFRRPINTVRLAISTFEKFGMIEVINNTITIPKWSKHQSLDRLEQKNEYMKNYMKEYREKQKQLAIGEEVNSKVNSKANVSEAEEDKDKEDKDKEDKKDKNIKDIGQMSDQLSLKCPDKTTPEKEIEKDKNIKKEKTKSDKEVKHKYGEYKNVLLSDSDLEKLKNEFPLDWNKRVETVSEYCASKGKSYSNYLATIRNWARKENKGGDNNGKYGSNIKFNIPKNKIDPGAKDLDEEIRKLGLL